MSKVSIQKGENRKENILKSLKRIEDGVRKDLEGKDKIVIKPDLTSTQKQSVSVHRHALEVILSFFNEITDKDVVIVGSARIGGTKEGFNNFGYYNLKKKYDIEFIDLYEEEDCEMIEIYSRDLNPVETCIPNIVLDENNYLISVSGLKTDDSVIASMGIKNMAGCMTQRPLNHDGYKAINLSIANLMSVLKPNLSIIDAFEAVEGESPTRGDIISMNLAISGTDFVSVDTVGAAIMGFNPYKIGYLSHCREEGLGEGEMANIKVTGNTDIARVKKDFRPHSKYEDQLEW